MYVWVCSFSAGHLVTTGPKGKKSRIRKLRFPKSEVLLGRGQKGQDGETQYILFSRSGYTDDLQTVADTRDDVQLFELSDLMTTGTNT